MNARGLFPEIEPYRVDTLKVSELHTVTFEEVGTPTGQPALFLHGGPGVGILPAYRRFFDPQHYRVILLDQRGAGRSTPHAELRENTTWHLVEDLEKLRRHLGVPRWVVFGGSWGSTLALCYAIAYPSRVAGLILRGIFLGRKSEIEWLHKHGANEVWPDQWEQFIAPVPLEDRHDIVAGYYKLFTSGTHEQQLAAGAAWSSWEATTMTLVPDAHAIAEMTQGESALAIGRIECHYTQHGFFLKPDNFILDNAARIDGLPCRMVQGRYDIICPVRSAWELHQALPKSDLRIVPDGAHSPLDPGMVHELISATEDFKGL